MHMLLIFFPAVFNRCQAGTEFLTNGTEPGYALRSDNHGIPYSATSLDKCIEKCRSYTNFECESVDYSSFYQKCVLHAVQQGRFKLEPYQHYTHHRMECIVPAVDPGAGE